MVVDAFVAALSIGRLHFHRVYYISMMKTMKEDVGEGLMWLMVVHLMNALNIHRSLLKRLVQLVVGIELLVVVVVVQQSQDQKDAHERAGRTGKLFKWRV